jgi:putative membrane protein
VLIRWAVNAAALWAAAEIVPGIRIEGTGTLIVAALVFGLVNTFVRPLARLIALPVTIATLGLFLLVVNAGMLGLAAAVTPGFGVDGFGAAVLGGLVVSLVGLLLGIVTKKA